MKIKNNSSQEKDINICRKCEQNMDGYCKKYEKWCNFAREMCDKIEVDKK